MRTNDVAPTAALRAALDALAAQDPARLPASSIRRDLRELLTATNRLHAELVRRVAAFDATGSSGDDGYRSTRAWLRVFGRLSHAGATRLVRAARLLDRLPRLADAAAGGAVSAEHVHRVDRLAERVGLEAVLPVEAALTEFASWVDPTVLSRACARVRRGVDEEATRPDAMITPEDIPTPPEDAPAKDSPSHGEGLAERDRLGWRGGRGWAGGRLDRRPPGRPETSRPGPSGPPGVTSTAKAAASGPAAARASLLRRLAGLAPDTWPVRGGRWPSRPPRPLPFPPPDVRPHVRADPPAPGQPGRDVTDDLGNRPSCDADVRRGVFEPAVAWTPAVDGPHQVVPDWLRRALHVRDAGCRFPGCDMPPEWTDAHLLRSPAGGGRVELGNLVLLCRHHHRFVHEGGWTITRDPGTGILETWRPDGGRYTLFDPPPG